jgi:PAS domain-containing protein
VDGAFSPRHRSQAAPHLRTGEGPILGRRIETTGRRRDGSEVDLELSVVRLGTTGTPVFNAFISDITERKHAEDALRFGEQRKSSLLRLSTRCEQATTLTEVLQAALDEVSTVLQYRLLVMYVFSEDGRTASLIDAQGSRSSTPGIVSRRASASRRSARGRR